MEIILLQHFIQVNVVCCQDLDLIVTKCVVELNNKETIVHFGHIQSISIVLLVIHEMRVTKNSVLLIPPMSSKEVIAINFFNQIHLLFSDRIQI